MNVHEYQAKQVLKSFGVDTPSGKVATTPEEIEVAAGSFAGISPIVVKAQIHAGGRGKAGGVKVTKTTEEAIEAAKKMLGMCLKTKQTGPEGRIVKRVYFEEGSKILKEFYISLVVDRAQKATTFIISPEGGTEIEEVAEANPEKILKLPIDIIYGVQNFHIRQAGFFLGLGKPLFKDLAKVMVGMYRTMLATDADQIEINPLAQVAEDKLCALDAKVNFDDNALFRHPPILAMKDEDEEDPAELEAAKHNLNYVKMTGNIGCMVNGAGLAMATMDIIKYHSGDPANFLDVGGGADEARVSKAFELILSDPNVKGIVVNIFGGIVKCDLIAQGVINASKNVGIKVPLVVRLSGTNFEKGKEMLQNSGLNIIVADNLNEAAEKIVKAVKTGA